MDFLQKYRFNVCFENASHPGWNEIATAEVGKWLAGDGQ